MMVAIRKESSDGFLDYGVCPVMHRCGEETRGQRSSASQSIDHTHTLPEAREIRQCRRVARQDTKVPGTGGVQPSPKRRCFCEKRQPQIAGHCVRVMR